MVINKMLDRMEPEEKRILQGVVLNLIGAIIIAIYLFPLIYMMGLPFTHGTMLMINYWILGIAFILTGTFTLRPRRTGKGIIMLGSISTIIGGILILSTMQIIVELVVRFGGTSLIYIFWNDIPILATFMISGTVLLLHGLILITTKRKNMKRIWRVIFASVGITIVVWVPRPLYLSLTSPSLTPFFATALYLNLIIVGIASLITCYFFINPIKKERTKLLMGIISIILGGVIIIISFLGILNFYIYVGGMNGEGIA